MSPISSEIVEWPMSPPKLIPKPYNKDIMDQAIVGIVGIDKCEQILKYYNDLECELKDRKAIK